MKTLRLAYFYPGTNRVELYVSEDGFNRTQPQIVTALPPEIHALVTNAMEWLAAQMPEGMTDLTQVILQRLPDAVATWNEVVDPRVPLTYTPVFAISVTGNGDKGETTREINSVPGPVTAATATLWDYLVANLS